MTDRPHVLSATRRAGFTIIEMIAVLTIMGILLAIAMPRLDSARFSADANVRLVRSALMQAQRMALEQQRDVIVSIDTAKQRVRVGLDRNNDHSIAGAEPYTWRPLENDGRFDTPPGGVYGSVDAPFVGGALKTLDGYPSVTFHRDGSASSDLQLYLSVQARGAPVWRAITLIQSTARADWYQKTSTGWRKGGF